MFQVKEVRLQLFFAKSILEKTMFCCFWTFQIPICDIKPQLCMEVLASIYGRISRKIGWLNGAGLSSYPVLQNTGTQLNKSHREKIFFCGGIPTNGHSGYKGLESHPNLIWIFLWTPKRINNMGVTTYIIYPLKMKAAWLPMVVGVFIWFQCQNPNHPCTVWFICPHFTYIYGKWK